MAKPWEEWPGNGMHVHISLEDAAGHNVFSACDGVAGPRLRQAIGGLERTMAEGMAIFAPNANAFRRFLPGSYAPMAPTWSWDNRTVALRVPSGPPAATRIEHRVAGADANPYLALAAILAGILHGLESRTDPGAPVTGNAYAEVAPSLPRRWPDALGAFRQAAVLPGYLGPEFCRLYATVKESDLAKFEAAVTPLEYDWHLHQS